MDPSKPSGRLVLDTACLNWDGGNTRPNVHRVKRALAWPTGSRLQQIPCTLVLGADGFTYVPKEEYDIWTAGQLVLTTASDAAGRELPGDVLLGQCSERIGIANRHRLAARTYNAACLPLDKRSASAKSGRSRHLCQFFSRDTDFGNAICHPNHPSVQTR